MPPQLIIICACCSVPFSIKPKEVNCGRRFCSHACADLARRRSLTVRFWEKVQVTSGCWLWLGAVDKSGYGYIGTTPGHFQGAHRVAWILMRGPIPGELWVLHNCPDGDNPLCVNPNHLWLGTHDDNMADMVAKGRHRFGSHAPSRRVSA